MTTITTRMGDGHTVEMSLDELRSDLEAGCADAVEKGRVEPLTESDYDYLTEMFASPSRLWGVERGNEAVLTKDGSTNTLYSAQLSSGVGLPLSREQCVRTFERAFGFDTMEVGHTDYSVKPAKPIVTLEQSHVEAALATTIIPIFYGFMPNLGLYFQPDGPFPNPSDLLPAGQIAEARTATEEAAQACYEDLVWMTGRMAEVGADGINYDTTASTGDGEFYATDDICTHAYASLSEGYIEDGCVECPLHAGLFDIKTGKAQGVPVTEDIKTYPVRVEGENIYIEL